MRRRTVSHRRYIPPRSCGETGGERELWDSGVNLQEPNRYGTARSTFSGLRLHALFLEAPNNVRYVHNAAPPYHTLFRPFRYHPGAARSPLKPVETASGC